MPGAMGERKTDQEHPGQDMGQPIGQTEIETDACEFQAGGKKQQRADAH